MDPTCPPTVRVSCRSSVLGPKFNVLVLVWPSCRAHQSKGTWDQCDFSQRVHLCVNLMSLLQRRVHPNCTAGTSRNPQGLPEVQPTTCRTVAPGRHLSLRHIGPEARSAGCTWRGRGGARRACGAGTTVPVGRKPFPRRLQV